jgi:hypothetical protein
MYVFRCTEFDFIVADLNLHRETQRQGDARLDELVIALDLLALSYSVHCSELRFTFSLKFSALFIKLSSILQLRRQSPVLTRSKVEVRLDLTLNIMIKKCLSDQSIVLC